MNLLFYFPYDYKLIIGLFIVVSNIYPVNVLTQQKVNTNFWPSSSISNHIIHNFAAQRNSFRVKPSSAKWLILHQYTMHFTAVLFQLLFAMLNNWFCASNRLICVLLNATQRMYSKYKQHVCLFKSSGKTQTHSAKITFQFRGVRLSEYALSCESRLPQRFSRRHVCVLCRPPYIIAQRREQKLVACMC